MATVFVKIAVAVDAKGKWNACGWSAPGKLISDDAMGIAVEGVGEGEARYYVTAVLQVPDPEAATVEGKVESASPF
jgi:hypothetical protein